MTKRMIRKFIRHINKGKHSAMSVVNFCDINGYSLVINDGKVIGLVDKEEK